MAKDSKLRAPYSKEFLARRSPRERRHLDNAVKAATFDQWADAIGKAFDAPAKSSGR